MNVLIWRGLAFGALLLFALGRVAAADTFIPCVPGAKVLYVNGVNKTDEQEVALSAAHLQRNIAHFSVTCVSQVDHLFNPSDGLITDLLREVAAQKAAELGVSFADALFDAGLVLAGQTSLLFNVQVQEEIRARLSSFIQEVSLSGYSFTVDGVTYTTVELVDQFRDRVVTELQQGTKTILVAHSQGNLFANETHAKVVAQADQSVSQGLAVVNIANAASSAPSGLWITSWQDLIIAPLWSVGAVTSPNVNAGVHLGDLSGHGFDQVYLNKHLPTSAMESNSMAAQVMSLLQQALNSAQTPVGTVLGSTSFGLFGLNLATLSTTNLDTFTYANSSAIAIWDIATSTATGRSYAISGNAVYSMDRATGTLIKLPSSMVGGNALALSQDGQLYGMGGNAIYQFDIETGAATALPITLGSYASSGDLTFDSEGNLWGTATGPGGSDSLIKIDLNRSRLTVIGPTGYSRLYGLYFSSGNLYGIAAEGTLITIDRTTGVGQLVRQLSIGDVTGLQ